MGLRGDVSRFAYSAVAVLLALLIGAVLIGASGYSVKEAYSNLLVGAFGGVYSLATTVVMSTPLLFTGLAVAFAFQCGLFNVGAEGQLYVGALTSAVVALALSGLPPALRVIMALAAGAGAGAALGFVPGYLKAKIGAHEVITTIMLNYIAISLTTFMVKAYFRDPGPVDQTVLLPPGSRLPELVPEPAFVGHRSRYSCRCAPRSCDTRKRARLRDSGRWAESACCRVWRSECPSQNDSSHDDQWGSCRLGRFCRGHGDPIPFHTLLLAGLWFHRDRCGGHRGSEHVGGYPCCCSLRSTAVGRPVYAAFCGDTYGADDHGSRVGHTVRSCANAW